MLASTRSTLNYYWSWRRYLTSNLSSYKQYYNPVGLPKPSSSTVSWLIFLVGEGNPNLFTRWRSQIHCVARDDERGENLITIVSDVITELEDLPTGRRSFALYDKTTEAIVGDIRIENLIQRSQVPYDTGISSVLIDIYTRVKTARNAYA